MVQASLSRDRVRDTTTTTGTGNVTLTGTAPTGFQNFNSALGTNTRFFYCIASQTGADWEVGQGYLSASTTLVREAVLASSNAGAVVNLAAGTKDVFVTIPAFYAERVGLNGRVNSRILGNILT